MCLQGSLSSFLSARDVFPFFRLTQHFHPPGFMPASSHLTPGELSWESLPVLPLTALASRYVLIRPRRQGSGEPCDSSQKALAFLWRTVTPLPGCVWGAEVVTLIKPSSLWKIKHETTRTGCYCALKANTMLGWRKRGCRGDVITRLYDKPWRRKWQPTPVFLFENSHGQRNLDYSPRGYKESDTTEQARTNENLLHSTENSTQCSVLI